MTPNPQKPDGETFVRHDQPSTWRRRLLLAALPLSLGLTGCASAPRRDRDPEGAYCHRSRLERYRKGPCISNGIPSRSVDLAAKRFESNPDLLTVFVVREHWMDGPDLVTVLVDDMQVGETLPDTMIRLQLKPGAHALALRFADQHDRLQVAGRAGDVRFVHLRGSGFSWNVKYALVASSAEALQDRAQRSRLVADVLVP